MMRKSLSFLVGLLALSSFSLSTLAQTRIISLKPNITEIIYSLGAGDRLVGATTYCTRPEAAKKLPRVADYIRANPEKILKLRPDLILISKENSSNKEIFFLMERGIPIEILQFGTFEAINQSVKKLGKILGKEKEAEKLLLKMNTDIAKLKKETQKQAPLKTLWVVGYEPLVVVGGDNFIHEAGKVLHLENLAGTSRMKYPTYSTEQLIRSGPELVIDLAMGSEASPKKIQEHLQWWEKFPSIPAVKNHRIIPYSMFDFRPVPSLTENLQELGSLIRPSTKPTLP